MVLEKIINKILPFNDFGDAVYSFLRFVYFQRRLPVRSQFNDALFRMKVDGSLNEPLRAFVTDKEYAKIFVSSVIGKKHVVPTIKVLRTVEELFAFRFPDQCVIKSTHGSQEVVLKHSAASVPDVYLIAGWFNSNFYQRSRERNHKFLKPKIIIEPFVFGPNVIPNDLKIFCFRGKARIIQVDINRFTDHKRAILDTEWNLLPIKLQHEVPNSPPERPDNLDAIIDSANTLAKYFDLIRIDFYTDGKDFYVGEITNCHGSASERFYPQDGEAHFSKILFAEDSA